MLCTCPSDALCDVCLDQRAKQLRGVAARRGETWGAELRAAAGGAPARIETALDRDLAVALARRRLGDITQDARLLEVLAGVMVDWATGTGGAARPLTTP